MSIHNNLLKARFDLNINRISALVKLIHSDFDSLKPPGLFQQSDGVRADILRAIVVFLHATFEDALRTYIPKANKSLSFYSRTDIDKALKLSGIDAMPFRSLYPTLTQMAKRRKRIVHDADLSNRTDVVSEPWGIADDWQLTMWLMAVPAFYYQLRISVEAANEVEVTMYEKFMKAMQSHVDFGHHLLSFPKVPPELRMEALQKTAFILETITNIFKPDVSNSTLDGQLIVDKEK
ncbi:MAG: hypothetical protein ABJB86_24800 [Bacteroidota bacterium]